MIAPALKELKAMGLIRIQKGQAYKGEHVPNRYTLTLLPIFEGQSARPASNDWKGITDDQVQLFKSQKRSENRLKGNRKVAQRQKLAHASSGRPNEYCVRRTSHPA